MKKNFRPGLILLIAAAGVVCVSCFGLENSPEIENKQERAKLADMLSNDANHEITEIEKICLQNKDDKYYAVMLGHYSTGFNNVKGYVDHIDRSIRYEIDKELYDDMSTFCKESTLVKTLGKDELAFIEYIIENLEPDMVKEIPTERGNHTDEYTQ